MVQHTLCRDQLNVNMSSLNHISTFGGDFTNQCSPRSWQWDFGDRSVGQQRGSHSSVRNTRDKRTQNVSRNSEEQTKCWPLSTSFLPLITASSKTWEKWIALLEEHSTLFKMFQFKENLSPWSCTPIPPITCGESFQSISQSGQMWAVLAGFVDRIIHLTPYFQDIDKRIVEKVKDHKVLLRGIVSNESKEVVEKPCYIYCYLMHHSLTYFKASRRNGWEGYQACWDARLGLIAETLLLAHASFCGLDPVPQLAWYGWASHEHYMTCFLYGAASHDLLFVWCSITWPTAKPLASHTNSFPRCLISVWTILYASQFIFHNWPAVKEILTKCIKWFI